MLDPKETPNPERVKEIVEFLNSLSKQEMQFVLLALLFSGVSVTESDEGHQ